LCLNALIPPFPFSLLLHLLTAKGLQNQTGQVRQADCPDVSWYWPAGQEVQAIGPTVFITLLKRENLPLAQVRQAVAAACGEKKKQKGSRSRTRKNKKHLPLNRKHTWFELPLAVPLAQLAQVAAADEK
jgi:hypothetical protein